MPSFSSHFRLPCPGGDERTAQKKAAAEEQKCLRCERARKQVEHQKCGSSSTDDDDDDDDEDSEEDDEGPLAL